MVIVVRSTSKSASVTVVPSIVNEPVTSPVRPTAVVAPIADQLLVDAEPGEGAGGRLEVELAGLGVDGPGALDPRGAAGVGRTSAGSVGDLVDGGVQGDLLGGVVPQEPPEPAADDNRRSTTTTGDEDLGARGHGGAR